MTKKENENNHTVEAFALLRVAAVYGIFVSHTYLYNWDIFQIGVVSFLFSAPAWAYIWVLFTIWLGEPFGQGIIPVRKEWGSITTNG